MVARAINDSGTIVGSVVVGPMGISTGFYWNSSLTNAALVDYGHNPGPDYLAAINSAGIASAGIAVGRNPGVFKYDGETATPVGLSEATHINASGTIVGNVGWPGLPASYSGSTYTMLDLSAITDPSTAIYEGMATAINTAGQIVGTASPRGNPAIPRRTYGFLYSGGSAVALAGLVENGNCVPVDINDRTTVVGYAYDATGAVHATI